MAKPKIDAEQLRLHLFAALERINHDNDGKNPLSNEEFELEIEKAKTVSMLADSIIGIEKVRLQQEALALKRAQMISQGKISEQEKKVLTGSAFFQLEN